MLTYEEEFYKMNIFKSIIAASAVAVVVAISGTGSANAATANKCTVADFGMAMGNSGNISVKGNVATVTFRVKGTDCSTPVTIASWKRVTPTGIKDQVLYTSVTGSYRPGLHTQTISLPDCLWQVDLLEGSKATADDGTADYVKFDGTKFLPSPLRDFMKPAGTNVCVDKPPVVVPPVVTPPVVTPPAPVVTTQTVVKSIPSTGAGDILAGTTGLSTSVGLAYNLIRRKKLMR